MEFSTVIVFAWKDTKQNQKAVDQIREWGHDLDLATEVVTSPRRLQNLFSEPIDINYHSTMVITLGGDGTFLRAAEIVSEYKVPVLGVTVESLGFLSSTNLDNLTAGLAEVASGKYELRHMNRLKATVETDEGAAEDFYAVNEVIVSCPTIGEFGRFEVSVNGAKMNTIAGDGIIVSTPAGSTAYSLASGGPLLVPETKSFCLTPLNEHQLSSRPVVIPLNSTVKIFPKSTSKVIVDGKHRREISKGQHIQITKASTATRALLLDSRESFFELVHSKLV